MSRPASNLRLFVAVYPPGEVSAALLEALARVPGMPVHAPTRAEQVHLTLQFIGDTPSRDMPEVEESVRRSASGIGALTLRPTRLIVLPERGPARLIAAATDSPPAMLELQRRLAHRLAKNARERPGERFTPHLTLARFTTPVAWRAEADLPGPSFVAREIVLVRSTLRAGGAEHREVMRVALETERGS